MVKLAWPNPQIASSATAAEDPLPLADPLTQFKTWANMLRDGDDENLERLNLPPADSIKRLAENPKVHGFLLERATVARLEGLLDDPGIRSVNVADVAFDLSQSQAEGLLLAQEGQDRQHPPVVLVRTREPELPEDARHVLLDRSLGDDELGCDPGVRAALSHVLEHFALARGERVDRVVAAPAPDELGDDRPSAEPPSPRAARRRRTRPRRRRGP